MGLMELAVCPSGCEIFLLKCIVSFSKDSLPPLANMNIPYLSSTLRSRTLLQLSLTEGFEASVKRLRYASYLCGLFREDTEVGLRVTQQPSVAVLNFWLKASSNHPPAPRTREAHLFPGMGTRDVRFGLLSCKNVGFSQLVLVSSHGRH